MTETLSRKKKIIFTLIMVGFTLLLCCLIYLTTIYWRSGKLNKGHVSLIGSAYRPDENYGTFPKAHSLAYHRLKNGKQVPILFDQNGYRIPVKKVRDMSEYKKKILFLGCSFSHGGCVNAEETFAYLAAEELHAYCMNAGVPGAGLSQMVLRARQDIPRFKPDYVVVQNSPWLAGRSMRFYKPTSYAKSPGPYFYESGSKILVHKPVFKTRNFDLPIAKYAGKSRLSFTWHVGIPLYLHDDFYVTLTLIKSLLGILPKPVRSRDAVIEFSYKEIERICLAYDAKMFVLNMYQTYRPEPFKKIKAISSPVIDPLEPLSAGLPERTRQAWAKQYCFWKKNPLRLIDVHPNGKAHRIIARTIVETIRSFDIKK